MKYTIFLILLSFSSVQLSFARGPVEALVRLLRNDAFNSYALAAKGGVVRGWAKRKFGPDFTEGHFAGLEPRVADPLLIRLLDGLELEKVLEGAHGFVPPGTIRAFFGEAQFGQARGFGKTDSQLSASVQPVFYTDGAVRFRAQIGRHEHWIEGIPTLPEGEAFTRLVFADHEQTLALVASRFRAFEEGQIRGVYYLQRNQGLLYKTRVSDEPLVAQGPSVQVEAGEELLALATESAGSGGTLNVFGISYGPGGFKLNSWLGVRPDGTSVVSTNRTASLTADLLDDVRFRSTVVGFRVTEEGLAIDLATIEGEFVTRLFDLRKLTPLESGF